MKQKYNQLAKRIQRNARSVGPNSPEIPSIQANVNINHTFRFGCTTSAPTDYAVTVDDLISSFGMIAATANSAYPIVKSFKLHSVKAWESVDSGGGVNTISIEWSDGGDGYLAFKEVSDTVISNARPAFVFARPPQGTYPSFWLNEADGTSTVFRVKRTAAANIVIDINVTMMLHDNTVGTPVTTSGATVGAMYYAPLDLGGNGNILPIGLTIAPL